jgi:hypothetical protein
MSLTIAHTDLNQQLRQLGIEHIILAGVTAPGCVEGTGQLRVVADDSELAQAVKVVARAHQTLLLATPTNRHRPDTRQGWSFLARSRSGRRCALGAEGTGKARERPATGDRNHPLASEQPAAAGNPQTSASSDLDRTRRPAAARTPAATPAREDSQACISLKNTLDTRTRLSVTSN